MIIGITGHMGAGKTTIAMMLRSFQFTRMSLASPVKLMAWELNPWVWVPVASTRESAIRSILSGPSGGWAGSQGDFRKLQEVVEKEGWSEAKRYADVRRTLQRMGTEAGRGVLGKNVWIDHLFNNMEPHYDYVIDDVRFENEAAAIRDAGGLIWRVQRPGYVGDTHRSEREIDLIVPDTIINNSGTLEDLQSTVDHKIAGGGLNGLA